MYTAHIRKEDNKVQTVSEHIEGVKKLSKVFSLDLNISSILMLTAILHDLGKMVIDFDDYINGRNNFKRGEIDHSFAGAKFLYEYALNYNDELIIDTAKFIGRIIISHHGLHDWIDRKYEDSFSKRISKTDRYDEIYAEAITFLKDDIEKILPLAAKEFENIKTKIHSISKNKLSFGFYLGMFERLAESILVDADRSDTSEFMLNLEPREINTIQLWNDMQITINNMTKEFRKKTDLISQNRMSISDRCAEFSKEQRGICRLIVPTGGGKTISSFRFAVDYCKRFNKDRIFYIAPFMSILEQNADVIKSMVGNDDLFLEHHSNIISEIVKENEDELNDYELKCEKWDNPVIATTMVQFLNAIFDGKMSSVRRFHRLCNSVIIIDEIQSTPVKCIDLFNLAMNFLCKICECTIVLCSATQPKFEARKFPLILDKESSMTRDFTTDFLKFKRTEIISDVKMPGFSFEETASYTYKKYKENGNALVILNTKKSALEVFKNITEINENSDNKAELIHLSTNMCPAQRKAKLDFMRNLLKKHKPVICVTTQLIEAGVDISFNCVIRSLAGLDSIAQAAGRCNRHGENKISPVYVIAVKGENLSNLKEIKEGKEISLRIMSQTDYDLLSDESMTVYFNMFYKIFENELSYPVTDLDANTNLVDLLSINKNRQDICQSKIYYKGQAFATAGQLFKVINEQTSSIIVPYNDDAEKIIADLNSDIDNSNKIKLLRKAQKYSVNVYSSMLKKLLDKEIIYELKKDSIFVLRKEHFNDDYGIDENANLGFMEY